MITSGFSSEREAHVCLCVCNCVKKMFSLAVITVTRLVVGGWMRAFQTSHWLRVSTVAWCYVLLHLLYICEDAWVFVSRSKCVWVWNVMQITDCPFESAAPQARKLQWNLLSVSCVSTHIQKPFCVMKKKVLVHYRLHIWWSENNKTLNT